MAAAKGPLRRRVPSGRRACRRAALRPTPFAEKTPRCGSTHCERIRARRVTFLPTDLETHDVARQSASPPELPCWAGVRSNVPGTPYERQHQQYPDPPADLVATHYGQGDAGARRSASQESERPFESPSQVPPSDETLADTLETESSSHTQGVGRPRTNSSAAVRVGALDDFWLSAHDAPTSGQLKRFTLGVFAGSGRCLRYRPAAPCGNFKGRSQVQ